jgi:glycosyltransferase involved in cell wall biosynthesis
MTATSQSPGVDIVVDVRGRAQCALRCLEHVRAHTRSAFRWLPLDAGTGNDDFAPPSDRELAGFATLANCALAGSDSDIVLLDARAIVTPGWLEALTRCAASDPRIATAMPFTNAVGLCGFPEHRCTDPWPPARDPAPILAALAAAAVPSYPDLPVAEGPCLYVRRSAFTALRGFDAGFVALGGAQRDFSMRAMHAHWRNTLADDAFVILGPAVDEAPATSPALRSDAAARDEAARDESTLALRHPYFDRVVGAFVAADPLRPLRDAALSRMLAAGSSVGVLHVSHDHGGGVEKHVRALINATSGRWRHCVATAAGDRWQVDEYAGANRWRRFEFIRGEHESWRDFIGGIAASFCVALIHLHHASRSRDGIVAVLPSLGLPYGMTIHDLWLACPTIRLTRGDGRYCNGVTDAALCTRCLDAQPAFAGVDIARWRREHATLVDAASFMIAPSQWAAGMFARYFPQSAPRTWVIAHTTPDARPRQPDARKADVGIRDARDPDAPLCAVLLPDDDWPTVGIVGAIGRDKGARRVERLAQRARALALRLRFVVIGYLDVQGVSWQSADTRLTVHGCYAPDDLPALFAHYRVALVAYPSECPETFSFTLSETWAAGLPALVPPIGALAERVAQSGAGWVMHDDEWHNEDRMLARIVALTSPEFHAERVQAGMKARHAGSGAQASGADETSRLYEVALAHAALPPISGREMPAGVSELPTHARSAAGFSPMRLRDALGYRAWEPPLIEDVPATFGAAIPASGVTAPASESGADARAARHPALAAVARHAASIRGTLLGRCLYRVAPTAVIDALKARLVE